MVQKRYFHRQMTTSSQTGILYLMDGISLFKSISYSLNCHSLRHMGQCACDVCEFTHFKMQWRWNAWLHAPQISGQSSPGSLQSGQQPSKAILHIPHVSSWASQVHEATACHSVRKSSAYSRRQRVKENCIFKNFKALNLPQNNSTTKIIAQSFFITAHVPWDMS